MPSAGIFSPYSKRIISPTTISSIGILIIPSNLLTLALVLEASCCNLSKAFSLPYSDKVEINEARKIAIAIPTVSYQSKSFIKNIVFIPRAINRIRIIGSPKLLSNCLKRYLYE